MAVNLKQLSTIPERLTGGHRLCAGCGASIAVRQILMGTTDPVVTGCATGCLEVATTIFPYTAWDCPFIHNAFENVAATMSGVETAYRALKKKGKIKKDIKFIAFGGDGGTYDIGIQSLSGMLERGHRVVYVCLPPKEELLLGNGKIITIGEFVENHIKEYIRDQKLVKTCEYIIKDKSGSYMLSHMATGTALLVSDKDTDCEDDVLSIPANNEVISWDGDRFKPSKIIRAQRKKSPENLIKITTRSGAVLKLTPEHKVLVDTLDGPVWKPAEILTRNDELYTPRKIYVDSVPTLHILDCISNELSIELDKSIHTELGNALIKKYGSIKKASEILEFKYWQLKENKRAINMGDLKNILRYTLPNLWDHIKNSTTKITSGGSSINIKTRELNPEIMYLLGLISSDGSISKKKYRIDFVNKEKTLIKKFSKLYIKHFGNSPYKIKDKNGVTYLIINNPILYSLSEYFNIKDNPKNILQLSSNLIAAYLKGIFDGDGHASVLHKKHSCNGTVIITTINETLAKRIRLMLQRLGIACFQDKREHRYDLTITSRIDIKRFIQNVGSNHPRKRANLLKIEKIWETLSERGRYFSLAPKKCGKLLAEFCRNNNISTTKFDKKRNLLTIASGKRRATKSKIRSYLDTINYYSYNSELNREINNLLNLDYFLDPVRTVERVPSDSKYVYDITVDTTHCFVPACGFVISNCYDNEAYMNCLSTSTLIVTKDGLKKITEIKVGDEIAAFDQKTHELVFKKCSGVFDNGEKEVFEVQTLHYSIKATGNHPFLSLNRDKNSLTWKTLENLKIEDEIVVSKNSSKKSQYGYISLSKDKSTQVMDQNLLAGNKYFELEKIKSVKSVGIEPTLDLRVEEEHNFIADGIVVHNTGIQRSGATPCGANTTTAPAGKAAFGKSQMPKDLTAIVAAHNIPYAAQVTISHWNDLITKAQKAFAAQGPAFINVLSPCHRGWRIPMESSVDIAKLAVETGFWPLYEVENGKWKLTYKPKQRKPIIEYIKAQGRFKHLLTPENQPIIDNIQKSIDEYWTKLEKLAAASTE